MKIEPALAQRFAVIGQIDQRSVVRRLLRQQRDRARHEFVGVQHGIVETVGDLFAAAVAKIVAVAGRRESTQPRRMALVVTGPVIAKLMQHDHQIAWLCSDSGHQIVQHHAIETAFTETGTIAFGALERHKRQPGAHALAARLVVAPLGADTCMAQHMQQRL